MIYCNYITHNSFSDLDLTHGVLLMQDTSPPNNDAIFYSVSHQHFGNEPSRLRGQEMYHLFSTLHVILKYKRSVSCSQDTWRGSNLLWKGQKHLTLWCISIVLRNPISNVSSTARYLITDFIRWWSSITLSCHWSFLYLTLLYSPLTHYI